MIIKLPNGLLDGADHFNHAKIDELRGKQQNYLTNKELVSGNIGHIPKILEDLVKELQTDTGMAWKGDIREALNKLPAGDLETILVKIRENTFGPKYYHETQCPHCEHKNKDLRVDLDQLQLSVMSVDDMLDSKKFTTILPKSKLEVELKPLYLKDLFQALKIVSGKQDELVTATLAMSIKRLGDNYNVTAKDLEEIAISDILHLNEFAENLVLEGSIDTDVTTDCSSCKKEFTYKLNVYDPSFFFPTRGYKSTST